MASFNLVFVLFCELSSFVYRVVYCALQNHRSMNARLPPGCISLAMAL